MKLAAFIASRRHCEDLRQIADSPYGSNNSEPEDYPNPIRGFAYEGDLSIRQDEDGFTAFIQFEESSRDLRSLELELFYWYGSHTANPSHELTLFDRVELACLQSDIDRALRYVQDGLGVESGDFAAMHFSDLAENAWAEMPRDERLQRLCRYIAGETSSEIDWRQSADSNSETAQLAALTPLEVE